MIDLKVTFLLLLLHFINLVFNFELNQLYIERLL